MAYQAYPKDFSQMIRLGLANSVEASYKIHYKLMSVIDLIFEEGNPVGIKALLEKIEGVEVMPGVRLPLVSATESLQLKLKEFVATY